MPHPWDDLFDKYPELDDAWQDEYPEDGINDFVTQIPIDVERDPRGAALFRRSPLRAYDGEWLLTKGDISKLLNLEVPENVNKYLVHTKELPEPYRRLGGVALWRFSQVRDYIRGRNAWFSGTWKAWPDWGVDDEEE